APPPPDISIVPGLVGTIVAPKIFGFQVHFVALGNVFASGVFAAISDFNRVFGGSGCASNLLGLFNGLEPLPRVCEWLFVISSAAKINTDRARDTGRTCHFCNTPDPAGVRNTVLQPQAQQTNRYRRLRCQSPTSRAIGDKGLFCEVSKTTTR